jgi:thiosulfate reductase cytochrome b subunit
MIPGTTTKVSQKTGVATAATIDVKVDVLYVTGTTVIATLKPNFGGGFPGICFVVAATDVDTTTSGNIAVAGTLLANMVTVFVYNPVTGDWHPSAIS